MAPQTVNNIVSTVSALFEHAVDMKVVRENPCEAVRCLKEEEKVRPAWTREQRNRFLEIAIEDDFQRFLVSLLAITLGMRAGEIRGLLRDAVDFDRGVITIRRIWDYRLTGQKNKLVERTKGKKDRVLPVPSLVVELLRKAFGNVPQNTQLFPNVSSGFGARHLKPLMERAQVPTIRMHDFRGTFSSQMSEIADLKVVQTLLGHVKVETTDRYLRLLPGKLDRSTETLVARDKDQWLEAAFKKGGMAELASAASDSPRGEPAVAISVSAEPSGLPENDSRSNVVPFDTKRRRCVP